MCGIAGLLAFDPSLAATPQTLVAMSAAVAHRGPDGDGEYFSKDPASPHVALAHRRLAILDPDPRSNQPFTDGRRRWLVFNGEIYNFRELRGQLRSRDWKTTGDTEVLLAAYEEWGQNCVDHLNGQYALAVWDARADQLFLARDRMGEKPLYYAARSGAIAFASEIRALLHVPWIDRSIDRQALTEYFRWGYIPSPRTIYNGIRQLLPSQTLTVAANGIVPNTTSKRPGSLLPGSSASAVPETRRLIFQAVKRQLISDVPLGCFLSGGIDSSIIAASMTAARSAGEKVLTFSIGFDDPRYDETEYAAAVAAHLGTHHHSFTVHPDAAADLPKIAAAFGQPFADSSALPTHYLSQQTRQHVKVALSGDGGDELFGGYDRYRALRLTQRPLPWPILKPLLNRLPGTHPKSLTVRLQRLAFSADLPPAQRYAAYMRLFDDAQIQSLFASPAPEIPDLIAASFDPTIGLMSAAMAVDRQTYLPDDLLTKVDRCSMLHALEVRCPFLDPDVVAFASGLHERQLFKRMLKQAFAPDLPAWVFRRPKMGFAVPIGDWLRTTLRPMLSDLLVAKTSFAAAHLNLPAIQELISAHDAGHADHSQRLYALLMLELWWKASA